MSVAIDLIIPSFNRSNILTTYLYVDNCRVCIPESQHGIYRERHPNVEYILHPDSVKGLALKRQWIYDRFRNIFMLDDDLKGLVRMTMKAGETSKINSTLAYDIIQNCGNVAKLMGCHLFSFNNYVVPEQYHGHDPLSLTGTINGCGMGLLEGGYEKLKFVEDTVACDDFFISGLNAHHFRKCLIDRRYGYAQDSFAGTLGGLASFRNNDQEEKDFKALKNYFGDAIRLKKEGRYRNKHAWSKSLKIPF